MKILLAACILGMAVCAPPQMYMEFDIHHAPAQAAQAIPAGAPVETLDVLLPVDDQRHPVGGPVRGFIKQEILMPNGRDTQEIFIPFGFGVPDTAAAGAAADPAAPAAPDAPAAPAEPAAPAAPDAPAAPAAPAAPVEPIVDTKAAAAQPSAADDDDDDD